MEGYIYILSNESMPGLIKIGRSINGARKRAKELNTTGVPSPFRVEFEVLVEDCVHAESVIHEHLSEHRVPNKEFFKMPVDEAKWYLCQSALWGTDYMVVHREISGAIDAISAMAGQLEVEWPILSSAAKHIAPDEWKNALSILEADMQIKLGRK